MHLSAPFTVLADQLAERLLVVLDLGQPLDGDFRTRDDRAAAVDAEADDDMAAEGQPAPAFDAAFVGRAEDIAVEIKLAGPHFARELHHLGEQPDHVAVAGVDDVRDAVLRGQARRAPRDALPRHAPAPASLGFSQS